MTTVVSAGTVTSSCGAPRLVAVQHDEPFAGGGPGADDHLAVGAEPSGAEHLVDEGVRDQAPGGGDVDDVVGVVATEAGSSRRPPRRGPSCGARPPGAPGRGRPRAAKRRRAGPPGPGRRRRSRLSRGPWCAGSTCCRATPTAPFGDQRARGRFGRALARPPPARWPWRTGPAPRRPAGAPGRRGWRRARTPPGRRAAAPPRRRPRRCR